MSFITFPLGSLLGSIGSPSLEFASVNALASFASTLFRYIYGFLAGSA